MSVCAGIRDMEQHVSGGQSKQAPPRVFFASTVMILTFLSR